MENPYLSAGHNLTGLVMAPGFMANPPNPL